METNPEPSPQKRAAPFLVIWLFMSAMLLFASGYVIVTKTALQTGELLFFTGSAFLSENIFLMWKRHRNAPD